MSTAAIPRAVSFWESQWQTRFVNIINADGDFNGTCDTTAENIPLLLNDNHCASWIPDVTVYCCGAVGGIVEQAATGVSSSSSGGEEVLQNNSTANEPVCMTSNFSDMLDCYKVTTDANCRSADVAPYGVCDPRTADTSRRRSGSSNASQAKASKSFSALFTIIMLATASLAL